MNHRDTIRFIIQFICFIIMTYLWFDAYSTLQIVHYNRDIWAWRAAQNVTQEMRLLELTPNGTVAYFDCPLKYRVAKAQYWYGPAKKHKGIYKLNGELK